MSSPLKSLKAHTISERMLRILLTVKKKKEKQNFKIHVTSQNR